MKITVEAMREILELVPEAAPATAKQKAGAKKDAAERALQRKTPIEPSPIKGEKPMVVLDDGEAQN